MTASVKFFAVLPVVHIGICYWYIFWFHAGFGGGSFNLVSPTDVFSVSVGKLAGIYLGLTSALVIAHIILSDKPTKILPDGKYKYHYSWSQNSAHYVVRVILWGSFIGFIIFLLFFKVFVSGLAIVCAGFLIGSLHRRIGEDNKINENGALALAIAFFFLMNFTSTAYRDGFLLRNSDPEYLEKDRLICNDYSLYRAVGGNFIGVRADGLRSIVSEDCKKLFDFPKSTIVVDMR